MLNQTSQQRTSQQRTLRERGYVTLPSAFSSTELVEIGALLDGAVPGNPETDDWGIEIVPLVERVPGMAAFLERPALAAGLEAALGGPVRRLYSGARLTSRGRLSFLPWHFHAELAGGGDGRWEPGRSGAPGGIRRVIATVYVDGATTDNGPLWLSPRRVGDPWAPPITDATIPWPGMHEVFLGPGEVAVWDVATYHAAVCRRGPRRIFGGIFERADGEVLR